MKTKLPLPALASVLTLAVPVLHAVAKIYSARKPAVPNGSWTPPPVKPVK